MSPAPAHQTPAIEAAFAEHYAFVRERLRGLGVAAADLDDATQDVFEVLVRRIADHDPERPIRAWMAGMARKVARRYRDRGRRVVVPLDEHAAVQLSPEERAARAQAWQVLERFVDELEPERWSVFVLSEIEGLRGSEIAAELGVNQNTVYARLRSARSAFERTLLRHRARERRGMFAVFVWPSSGSRRWVVGGSIGLFGSVALGSVLMISAGHCSGDEQAVGELVQPSSSSQTEVATRPSNPRSLGADTVEQPSGESWVEGGSGFSMGSNAKGQRYTLSTESRHRLDGDRVILEVTYIGDDVDIDGVGVQLDVDGLELVDGELSWQLTIPAEQVRTVTTTLRATREGVVRLRASSQHRSGGGSGSSRFVWVREHGVLRPCDEHECEAPIGDEQLSGERITVHAHNQCSVTKRFVLFAGYPEVRPSDTVKVHSLAPGERRTMEIDAAQWFLGIDADGRIGGGVRTGDDGAHVTFWGSGDECSNSRAQSPDFNSLPRGDAALLPG